MARYQAAICMRGHVVRADIGFLDAERRILDTDRFPNLDNFCGECGAQVIPACPDCRVGLRGAADTGPMGLPDREGFQRPDPYCFNCGKPLPWTASALEAVRELALDEEALTDVERSQLVDSVGALAAETTGPGTTIAASRLRRITGKMAKLTGETVYKIAVDVASAAAKREAGL